MDLDEQIAAQQKYLWASAFFVGIVALGLTLVLLAGCSSLQVSSDYDPGADFSQYKTFGWPTGDRPPEDALAKNPLVAKRIEHSIGEAKRFMADAGLPVRLDP